MPSISLKLIVGVQWMLVTWATLWQGASPYTWGNVTAIAMGIWAIADKQSVDAVFMYIITSLVTIIVDIVMLAVFFPSHLANGFLKFSAGMAIVNLILKPFVLLLLYQMYKDRGGEYNINFGPNSNTSYDNIGEDDIAHQTNGSTAYVNPPIITKQ